MGGKDREKQGFRRELLAYLDSIHEGILPRIEPKLISCLTAYGNQLSHKQMASEIAAVASGCERAAEKALCVYLASKLLPEQFTSLKPTVFRVDHRSTKGAFDLKAILLMVEIAVEDRAAQPTLSILNSIRHLADMFLLRAEANDALLRTFASRPPGYARTICQAADVYFGTVVGENGYHILGIPRNVDRWHLAVTPEEFAESVSKALIDAHVIEPIRPGEMSNPPIAGEPCSLTPLHMDQIVFRYRVLNASNLVFSGRYRLTRAFIDGSRSLYHLEPVSLVEHLHFRLGYGIRNGASARHAVLSRFGEAPSFGDVVSEYVRKHVSSLAAYTSSEGRPRIMGALPVDYEILVRLVGTEVFREEIEAIDLLSREIMTDGRELLKYPLRPHLTVHQALRLSRVLRLFAQTSIRVRGVEASKISDEAFHNSATSVIELRVLKDIFGKLQVPRSQMEDFLGLISFSFQKGKPRLLDLQYTPFCSDGDYLVIFPVFASYTHTVRNLFAQTGARKNAGHEFTRLVHASLIAHLDACLMERQYSKQDGEFDVIGIRGRDVYLFECKHVLPPATTYEESALWQVIEHARDQLRRGVAYLRSNRGERLKAWFGDALKADPNELVYRSCIVLSARNWSGCSIDGVPIRDYWSLDGYLNQGTLTTTEPHPLLGQATKRQWSYWRKQANGDLGADLDAYLSGESLDWVLKRNTAAALCEIAFRSDEVVLSLYEYDAGLGVKTKLEMSALINDSGLSEFGQPTAIEL